jgi:hypothetical protein
MRQEPDDLYEVTESDLTSMGVPLIHRRKLILALENRTRERKDMAIAAGATNTAWQNKDSKSSSSEEAEAAPETQAQGGGSQNGTDTEEESEVVPIRRSPRLSGAEAGRRRSDLKRKAEEDPAAPALGDCTEETGGKAVKLLKLANPSPATMSTGLPESIASSLQSLVADGVCSLEDLDSSVITQLGKLPVEGGIEGISRLRQGVTQADQEGDPIRKKGAFFFQTLKKQLRECGVTEGVKSIHSLAKKVERKAAQARKKAKQLTNKAALEADPSVCEDGTGRGDVTPLWWDPYRMGEYRLVSDEAKAEAGESHEKERTKKAKKASQRRARVKAQQKSDPKRAGEAVARAAKVSVEREARHAKLAVDAQERRKKKSHLLQQQATGARGLGALLGEAAITATPTTGSALLFGTNASG